MRVRRRPNVPGRVAVSAVRVRNEVMVMKIFGLMVLKNEGDIVGQTLEAALAWCDRIAILDNRSPFSMRSESSDLGCTQIPFTHQLRLLPVT